MARKGIFFITLISFILASCGGGGGSADNTSPADTTAPDTSITSFPVSLVNQSTSVFEFSSNETGVTYEVSIDGGDYTEVINPYTVNNLNNGSHTLNVRAVDASTNTDATPATYSWVIDTIAPTGAIVFPGANSITDADTLTIRGTATDLNGISNISVAGITALTDDNFATWTAEIPVSAGQNNLVASITDAAGNVNNSAASVSVENTGTPTVQVRAMDTDNTNNRILSVDLGLKAVIATNLSTGNRSILSDENTGSGQVFKTPEDIVVDSTNNKAYILDYSLDSVIAVDLMTGNRTLVSGPSADAATQFSIAAGITLDKTRSQLFVIERGTASLISIALSDGTRLVVSSGAVGSGVSFSNPLDVVVDDITNPALPRLLVSDTGVNGIIAVDMSSGNRSIFSDTTPNGSGTAFASPWRMQLDSSNSRVLVIDASINRNALVAVDLATGNRTILADSITGTGVDIEFPLALAFDSINNKSFISPDFGGELIEVNLASLARNLVSDTNIGAGNKLRDPRGIQYDAANNRLLLLDTISDTLIAIDTNTGDRTVVSGGGVGTGTFMSNPQDLVIDTVTNPSSPQAYVVDSSLGSIFRIDIQTGDRTIISSAAVGTGPVFGTLPRDLALDTDNNRLLLVDSQVDALYEINLSTGNRTIVSNSSTGTGINFNVPGDVIHDNVSNPGTPRALVTDSQLFGLVEVDLATGDRVLFSSNPPTGLGISFLLPNSSVIDETNLRALVTDSTQKSLISVSLANGNRSLVSGNNASSGEDIGTGPTFAYTGGIDLVENTNIAYILSSDHKAVLAVDVITGDRVIISR